MVTTDVARVLSSSTKSRPYWPLRTPRWILHFLRAHAVVPVDGGVYQVNRVGVPSATLRASYSHHEAAQVESSAGLYEPAPGEVPLEVVQSIVRMPKRVQALFSDHHDQLQSQIGIASEFMYETVDDLAFNHSGHGLLHNVAPQMQLDAAGPPTPDVFDDLLALAWRRPDLFVLHPDALAAFRKAANARSLTLEEVEIFGSSFTTWRGLPLVPTDKLALAQEVTAKRGRGAPAAGKGRTTSVLLVRLGEAKQGVVYLCPKGTEDSARLPHITVDFMGMRDNAVASYLMTAYTAMAVLSPGALARADVTV